MRKHAAAVLVCAAISIAVLAWTHFATAGNPPSAGPFPVEIDPVAATAGANPGMNYSTGFEPGEGFGLGYISNSGGTPAGCGGVAFPCWGHTTSTSCPSGAPGPVCTFSLATPTIDSVHPSSGVQHLRLAHDPTTRTNFPGFGLGVDARYPRAADLSPRPVAPNTVSVDMAISGPGGQDFRVQPQSNSQGLPATSVLFFYTGEIYVLDDLCGATALAFQPAEADWDTTGAFQSLIIAMDPCVTGQNTAGYGGPGYGNGTVNYYYGGNLIYTGCVFAGSNLEQFLVFGDNYEGSSIDVDNVVLSSLDECPHTCGNGIIEYAFETCEVTPGGDTACPGRCIAAGQPDECTCTPICTQAEPCPVVNGENGPFISSEGFYVYSGTSPYVSVDACGSDFDGFLTLTASNATLITNANCEQSGANSDPTAPCYVPSGSEPDPCTCVANPNEPVLISVLRNFATPPLGSTTYVNIRKKAACAGASVGACCDTNGPDQGCTDNVTSEICSGADKVWTDQSKCVDQTCECIPDCTGLVCGSDGCAGSCGNCDDAIACTVDSCSAGTVCLHAPDHVACSNNNICDGVESCDPASGCITGTPLNCNDGEFCNGVETCNPSSGCVAGTPVVCDDGQDCSIDSCDEATDACIADDSGCAIPTVSQWGLIVLTILLLVAAKVQFGRVQ